jgi:hypothetical protein
MVALLKPFMLAQRLLEGQSYITISLIPYMLYKIRSGLMAANADPMASQQVRSVSTIMLRKFNEEFGTGEENTVASDHLVEGNRRRLKGLPKIVMIALYLDPRTKSAVSIPLADHDVIWQFVFDDLLNLALQLGPPPADAAILPNVHEDAQPLAQEVIRNNFVGRADDVIDFLHELDENEAEDDLQELIDANNNPVILIQGAEDTWNHNIAGEFIRAEIASYKSAKGVKLKDPETGKCTNPLDWWRVHETNYPYLAKLAMKYLAILATSAPPKCVFSFAGLTIAKDRAHLDCSQANELVFLHDCVLALEEHMMASCHL